MSYSNMPLLRLLPAYAVFAAALCCQEPVKLDDAILELDFKRIVVSSSSNGEDFAAAVSQLGSTKSWTVTLGEKNVRLEEVLINVATRAIALRYVPGDISVLRRSDIPKDKLVVVYRPLGVRLSVPTQPPKTPPVKFSRRVTCLAYQLSDDKKNANIDVSGGLQAGVNAKPQYFWSVKADCPIMLGSYGEIGPSFTGEASQQTNADPDSLKAAVTYRKVFAPASSRNGWILKADPFGYEFERSVDEESVLADGAIEAQQLLKKNSNLMFSGMARYVNAWPALNWSLGFLGFEAGRSNSRTIRSASQTTDNQPITRLHFDFDAYRTFFLNGDPILTFHGHHTLRLPFHQEPFKRADMNDGRMILTNKQRHWSLVELLFLINDGLSLNVQYKRGSLPPSFQFVNHQVSVGFNLLLEGP